ncbi:MAG: cob(I)yrinic acid a,c-diamide adenosyltransferase, partial [Candidatus Methylomirabilaceae bacterium]
MKIYTKMGDRGETGLIGGTRVLKSSLRVEAYGEVDELNALLGAAMARVTSNAIKDSLLGVQRDLFAIGAQLADPGGRVEKKAQKAAVGEERVKGLEGIIDKYEATLPPLRSFILPGGVEAGALLHLARTVCRRAERRIVALAQEAPLPPTMLVYMNRLSDLLFVLARAANREAGVEE